MFMVTVTFSYTFHNKILLSYKMIQNQKMDNVLGLVI